MFWTVGSDIVRLTKFVEGVSSMPVCEIKCKTRGGSSPQGKPCVFFCCHPEDSNCFFEEVLDSILKTQNCAVWYLEDPGQVPEREELETDLGQMQLFVDPVTTKLLTKPNFAMDTAVPFALEKHIPVLPLMQEDGLFGWY